MTLISIRSLACADSYHSSGKKSILPVPSPLVTTLTWIDLLIIVVPLVAILCVAYRVRRYATSVADFLAASRVAGRYLISNARGEAQFGAITAVAFFQKIYHAGFSITWWEAVQAPALMLLAMTGFVLYRYRETRVLTLAQFFEVRYSKRFRVCAGFVTFLSGILNFGIFPAVSSRFMVYFCGLPETVWGVPTFAVIMVAYLSLSLLLTLSGGQLTILVVDCLEGLLSYIFYLVVMVGLVVLIKWQQITDTLTAVPAGHSLLNPFDAGQVQDFNLWFVLIGIFGSVYGVMGWQGTQGFNASAASPHEARMGGVLGQWRGFARIMMFNFFAIAAYVFLNSPDFATQAAPASAALDTISNPQIQNQMRVPVALSHLLPVGIKGVFCATLLFAMLATDGSFMHSWGSILVQDVILPFRKKPLTPHQHLRWLRWAIVGVVAFVFLFSLLFPQPKHILMFMAITGAIYGGWIGSVVIGGLYWRKGTTAGAWAAIITGAGMAVGGIVMQLAPDFPINGQWMYFIAMLSSIVMYVVVSLLTCRQEFDLDKMLHRAPGAKAKQKWSLGRLLGFDENFTRGDKFVSGGLFVWGMVWFTVCIVGTVWNLVSPWPTSWWAQYWRVTAVAVPLVIGVVTAAWFTWGGLRDLRRLFRSLRSVRRDARDDGTVVNHRNLGE
jgi:SSS family solute:Na+ symporter